MGIEHPEISWINNTGYPSWLQEDELHCCACGRKFDVCDDVYEDRLNDYLCLECLLRLHKKEL